MVNLNNIFEKFYENTVTDFNDIDFKNLIQIIRKAKKLNNFFRNNNMPNMNIIRRYAKIMELIYNNQNKDNNNINNFSKYARTNSVSEKLLLYMLSIDPNFEALIIFESCNTTKEIKKNIELKFGVYDPNLIKIEKHYLKRFAGNIKKEQMNEEIEKRVFK